ncbi:MAG: electron transfer flavoprotein subunit beta/FixA family protein [Dissulfurimicrobium sp.]|uniref:electron transfer flavoprotein subunit beta/FixA family protein n=1 Tax=Dissulfurimicrobium sp. TaxID=2022436 RepID=UPI004049B987
MPFNIVICIKQVPDAKMVSFDTKTGIMIREGMAAVINPVDLNAIEAGLRLKDALGGQVTAVSMGPPQAQDALREAMAMGVDKGVLLSDRAFAGSDTLATTYILARAIERLGADIVLCGRQSMDGDTAQVGPGLAARLNIPCIAYIKEITPPVNDGGVFRLMRETDFGYDVLEVRPPFLLTVLSSLNTPRMPSLKGKLRAKRAEITVWNAADIQADPKRIGLEGSPTRVVSTYVRDFDAKREMLSGTAEEQAAALVKRLKDANLL